MSKIYDALIKLERNSPGSKDPFARRRWDGAARPVIYWWKDNSLEWRIIGIIASILLVLGLLLTGVMYRLLGQALRSQIDQRALVAATNLSDAAAGYVIGKNTLELHALVTKHARFSGSAYAFIEDHKGQILAHSLYSFPSSLGETLNMNERRQINRRVVSVQGKTVYEVRTPILEGQLGAAHIGVWEEDVAREIYNVLLPIVGLIAILILAGTFFFAFLVREIIRWLADREARLTTDDLDASIDQGFVG